MDLQQEKEESKRLELATQKLYFNFVKQKHERFEFADISQRLAYEKKGEDLLFLGDALTKWHNGTKKDEQKKELLSLIQCVWRLDAYTVNIETVIKQAVAEHVTTERRNVELVSKIRTMEIESINLKKQHENEIKILKQEIEFISSK